MKRKPAHLRILRSNEGEPWEEPVRRISGLVLIVALAVLGLLLLVDR